jgi:uncharacterized phiE125 gp8 family phage protein
MLIRLSTPSGLAAQLEDVKEDLRVGHDDDDAKIERLIRQETDRYQDFTGRVLLPTDYEWRTDSWREPICLPVYPIREVTEVVYLDGNEAEQTLDPWRLVSGQHT